MMIRDKKPIRVLHVLGGLNLGGVETWLMHVLRGIDRRRFQMDFLVHTCRPCAYDAEVRQYGSAIFPCLHPHQPWKYARRLRNILQAHGPYHVVHSHVHDFSGYVLRVANHAGIPIRIAHSHNSSPTTSRGYTVARRCYLALMKRWITLHSTIKVAISKLAAAALFGENWRQDSNVRIVRYGLDFSAFAAPVDRKAVRAEFGIPDDALVLGHVGRFHEQKNHRLLIEVFRQCVAAEPTCRLLLIGSGPLRPEIEEFVAAHNLQQQVIFAGNRRDVARVMAGAMDIFVFPSLWEGLGIVVLEAEAAGLPCIISNAIPEEADVIPQLIRRLSPQESPQNWARAILQSRGQRLPSSEVLPAIEDCFGMARCIRELEEIYTGSSGS
jgi:glycosyltransferase involved in cell wall biosynthesis